MLIITQRSCGIPHTQNGQVEPLKGYKLGVIDYFYDKADVRVATLGSTGTHRTRSPPSDPAGGNNRAETEEIGSRYRASKLVVNILVTYLNLAIL